MYGCIFLTGAVLAVYFFVSNLSKLALSRMNTKANLNVSAEDIALDEFQQKMLNLAARYLLLFGVATLSSIAFSFGGTMFHNTFGWGLEVSTSIDLAVNLLCSVMLKESMSILVGIIGINQVG